MVKKNMIAVNNRRRPSANTNQMVEEIAQVQDFNNDQIYSKGFSNGFSAGVNAVFNIPLGGKARFLHGVAFFAYDNANLPVATPDRVTLTINSEIVINNVIWFAYNPNTQTGNTKLKDFFVLPRPLSGSDSVELIWTGVNAGKVFPVFYLSDTSKLSNTRKK